MRVVTVIVLVAVVLVGAAPAAGAQDERVGELPSSLFEPAADGVVRGAGAPAEEDGSGAPILLAALLLAAAAVGGYVAGSSSRTRRS